MKNEELSKISWHAHEVYESALLAYWAYTHDDKDYHVQKLSKFMDILIELYRGNNENV